MHSGTHWKIIDIRIMFSAQEHYIQMFSQMRQRQCDIMTVHNQMQELADANPGLLRPLMHNEQKLVTMIRSKAPERHRKAAHWSATRREVHLDRFFDIMIDFKE